MLGASWAQRQTYSLRLARSIRPRYTPARHIALPLPKSSLQDGVEQLCYPTFTPSVDRPRGPRYSTAISSVAEQAVALLKANKVEEAASIVSQFPAGEANQALVVEVVDQFLGSTRGEQDSKTLFSWLESFPDANSASSDVFHEIFDCLVAHNTELSLIRRFGLLCVSKGYQDFVAIHVTPKILKRSTHSEAARWEDEIASAAAEFKGLQRTLEGVLEEDGLDYALAPPTVARASTVMQQVEETLPAVLPAILSNEGSVFEDDGAEYVTSAIPFNSDSTQSRIAKAMEELIHEGRWADAHTFLQELQGIGALPPANTCTIAINSLLEFLLDPTRRNDDTKIALRSQYLDWVLALPPALTNDNVPFVKNLVKTLFRTETNIARLALDTAVALASRGYAFHIASHVIRTLCTHPRSHIDFDFVTAMEAKDKEFWERYSPEIAEKRTKSSHLKIRSLAIRNLAAFGSFDKAIQFFPAASEGYLPEYDVLLRRIRAAGPDAVAKYESQVLSRTPERTDTQRPPLPGGSDLAASYSWLVDAFEADKPPPHPMAILDFINAHQASSPTDSNSLTDLLNKAMLAGPLHTSAFLYAEVLYYYRQHNFDAIMETVKDHVHVGYGMPRALVENTSQQLQRERRKRGPFVENPRSHRFHSKDLNISGKIWAPTALCNVVWQTNAKLTHDPTHVRKQYDLLVETVESSKRIRDDELRAPEAKASYYPNGDAFVTFMKKLAAHSGPQAGAAVINDLIRLGLQPKIAHFSELAYSYAMSGESEAALTILRKLQAGSAAIGGVEGVEQKVPYGSPQNATTPPLVPDTYMYAHLANAFVKKRRIKEAETVLRELETFRKDETKGSGYVERVREDLELLKLGKARRLERKLAKKSKSS